MDRQVGCRAGLDPHDRRRGEQLARHRFGERLCRHIPPTSVQVGSVHVRPVVRCLFVSIILRNAWEHGEIERQLIDGDRAGSSIPVTEPKPQASSTQFSVVTQPEQQQ